MSRHRNMLLALVRAGKTPVAIAAEVPMNAANVERTLRDDWPVQKRFVDVLEDYTHHTLREAYRSTTDNTKRAAIAAAYERVFSRALGDRDLSPSANKARYVAWLLAIKRELIFPLSPETGEEADEHLRSVVRSIVDRLLAEAQASTDRCPEALRYLRTLTHADDVIEGRADPAVNDWEANRCQYRRGIYIFQPEAGAAQEQPR
jgi:hypothetical protein